MKNLFLIFIFINNLFLSQNRILFSIDSVTFYQSPKFFDTVSPIEDSSVIFYSEIDYYTLYDLDLNLNTITIYYNRNMFKYNIIKKEINSDFIVFDVNQKTETQSPAKYKIYLNENVSTKLNYFYYDKYELLTFGFFSKNIRVLNCE
jgi:hypothetical protein